MRIVTCEHAANKVPGVYKHLFKSNQAILKTHQAYDAGALELARGLAGQLNASFFLYSNTRLLIDVNRSLGHPRLFSCFTNLLDINQKNQLIEHYYKAYRRPVENIINAAVKKNQQVLHVSVHSFTPLLTGKQRNADIGLLYNPARQAEVDLSNILKKKIQAVAKGFKVRCNYPYQGKSDSLVSFVRNYLPPAAYLGIELEINQKILGNFKQWRCLKAILGKVFSETAESYDV
ncbi:MAG: N-formylglutamate amidohydrolase [Candidatus Omnitrophica bacterium]|nr:N-formylglutamate amidohydrolase [Candidatus Omnitrophota bacterium]